MSVFSDERAYVLPLQALIDRGNGAERRHPAVAASRADRIASGVLPEHPTHRPLERFWPYADLPEAPSDEELALLHPELREALFGTPARPFSISIEFPAMADDVMTQVRTIAADAAEWQEIPAGTNTRYRARFYPGDKPLTLRSLYELVGDHPDTRVLIDDRPLPYARELWLPLVWCLIR